MIRRILVLALFAAVAASQARAGDLLLTFDVSGDGSAALNGTTLPVDSFQVTALFSTDNLFESTTGSAEYLATSISAQVDNMTYVANMYTFEYTVLLVDETNTTFPGEFIAGLYANGVVGFPPIYTRATTPGWSANSPTSTGFTGYTRVLPDIGTLLPLYDYGGDQLILSFHPAGGITTFLTAVPEPSSIAMAGIAALGGLGVWARRRRSGAAA